MKPIRFFSYVVLASILTLGGCKKDEESISRTFRMGFQNSAPRFDNLDLFIQSLNLWTQRIAESLDPTSRCCHDYYRSTLGRVARGHIRE